MRQPSRGSGGFERLTQRLLLEANFRNVEVLGRSSEGGIDGVGTLRVSLVAFPVYFQCKRYRGSVSASAVREADRLLLESVFRTSLRRCRPLAL
jgi:hypothetical protein